MRPEERKKVKDSDYVEILINKEDFSFTFIVAGGYIARTHRRMWVYLFLDPTPYKYVNILSLSTTFVTHFLPTYFGREISFILVIMNNL